MASFSRIEDAVEAVDFEVARMGPGVEASAKPTAAWRFEAVDPDTAQRMADLSPPRRADTEGQAQRLLAWSQYWRTPRT